MERNPASLWLCVVLSFGSYLYILHEENKAYIKALRQSDAGYADFMQKSINGHKLFEYIDPHSVGIFKMGKLSIACGTINQELPNLPLK